MCLNVLSAAAEVAEPVRPPASDYDVVRNAIEYITDTWRDHGKGCSK